MSELTVSDIEDKVACNEMSAAQVVTKLKQLVESAYIDGFNYHKELHEKEIEQAKQELLDEIIGKMKEIPEINPSNYTDADVDNLNDRLIELYQELVALKEQIE